ncbi:MAG: hypothetical protein IJ072_02765 [Oscillospiraceae bacterium]|nr:hypothetical protein [Oscillospiraceae bacterium]
MKYRRIVRIICITWIAIAVIFLICIAIDADRAQASKTFRLLFRIYIYATIPIGFVEYLLGRKARKIEKSGESGK